MKPDGLLVTLDGPSGVVGPQSVDLSGTVSLWLVWLLCS